MGPLKGKKASFRKIQDLSLRSFFLLTVFSVFAAVVAASGAAIWGCAAFRRYLLPEANAAYLTIEQDTENGSLTITHLLYFGEEESLPRLEVVEEDEDGEVLRQEASESGSVVREVSDGEIWDATYRIQKVESGYDTLTPRRKLAYRLCGAAMVAVPAVLSVGGILFCGFFFYRRKLTEPLRLLSEATRQIAARNLDFSLEYACGDEMGELCRSFEAMRGELEANNRAMWQLMEQRRLTQASIAHDLRNPIAIMEGYTEYLQKNLPKLAPEKTARIAGHLNQAAKRLEQYTESVRELNRLEDMEICREEVPAGELTEAIGEDFGVMAGRTGVSLRMDSELPDCTLQVDRNVLYRILENVFENAARFAESCISISFTLEEHMLRIVVEDDGAGFPEEMLGEGGKAFRPARQAGHLGMGLAIGRTLCERHGGSLRWRNKAPQGAAVEIILAV